MRSCGVLLHTLFIKPGYNSDMDNTQQLIQDYLKTPEVMQLATVRGGQPWCSTVHFFADGLKLYWCSSPETRHSKELQDEGRVAVAIVVKQPYPPIGVQMEGDAVLVDDAQKAATIMQAYAAKHHRDPEWAARVARQEATERLYCFTPRFAALFDLGNRENIRREWRP